jgi:hypothetical protein
MIKEDHKEIASGKKQDDEGYMARVELDQIERSLNNLRRSIKSGKQQLPAWVQSKITRAADFIDTAAEYLQSDEEVNEDKEVRGILKPTDPKTVINKDDVAKQRRKNLVSKKLDVSDGEKYAAKNIAKKLGGTGAQLPKFNKEEISLVEKILGEEKCGKGMYWCNTDKVCKPLPGGFKVDGQKKKPTEVGIGKAVKEEKSCNHSKKGKYCPVHGKTNCSIDEEKDPKGPVQSYKSPKEIAKRHGVSLEAIQKQLKMGIKVEGEHTSDKTAARITALQHLDEVPDYYTKLKKVETQKESKTVKDYKGDTYAEFVDIILPGTIEQENPKWKRGVSESVRLQAQNGNIISVVLSWRGKYYSMRLFFPQVRMPNRKEVTTEIQKIYPGSRLVNYTPASLDPNQPIVQVQNSKSKNYLLNNNTIGEEVEISEAKKSEMPCNKPKSDPVGDFQTGKSHVVKACKDGKEKLIRFGQRGVKGSPKKKGESKAYAKRREKFKIRHAKNIAQGPMSAAYWANKVKW